MTAATTNEALTRQYVSLSAKLVTNGDWACLWNRDGGQSGSLFPVLAVLGHGYPTGAFAKRDNLCAYTGLTPAEVQQGLVTLTEAGLITDLRPQSSTTLYFTVRTDVLGKRGGKRRNFTFPGVVVADGIWASISAEERNVLIALLALADKRWYDKKVDFFAYRDDTMEWLLDLYTLADDSPGCQMYMPRVGHIDEELLSIRTGIPWRHAWKVMVRASERLGGRLLRLHAEGCAVWFQLGEAWDVPGWWT